MKDFSNINFQLVKANLANLKNEFMLIWTWFQP